MATQLIKHMPGFWDAIRMLALGAFDDPDPDVRRACVSAIQQFVAAPLAAAMGIMANTLDREEDVRVREEKQRLLAVVLFGANWTDHVETAEEGIAQFRQRCLDRTAALREASDGSAEHVIVLPAL